jgi:hypothetical protein
MSWFYYLYFTFYNDDACRGVGIDKKNGNFLKKVLDLAVSLFKLSGYVMKKIWKEIVQYNSRRLFKLKT